MTVCVGDLFEMGKDRLSLEVEAGETYFDRPIMEASVNRPGLALAGFFRYFANQRVQVFGLAEFAYMKGLSVTERKDRLEQLCSQQHVPCFVAARNRHPGKEMIAAASRHQIPVFRTPMVTSRFINEATIILEGLSLPRKRVQGTMVDILGMGVLLEGQPGVGKSEAALALIERGHSLVSDDVTMLQKDSFGDVIGSAINVTRYHMEIRGLGIVHIPSLFGVSAIRRTKRLDLIIELRHWAPDDDGDRSGLSSESREVLGESIPMLRIPVAPGREIANVVEVAALNQKLKGLGHDAAKELDQKLVKMLTERDRT